MAVFAGRPTAGGQKTFLFVPQPPAGQEESILANIEPTIALRSQLPRHNASDSKPYFPTDYLEDCIRDSKHIDTLMVSVDIFIRFLCVSLSLIDTHKFDIVFAFFLHLFSNVQTHCQCV